MKLNWNKIRSDYVNGHLSYAKLAAKHKVSIQQIKKVGSEEKWVEQRKQQQAKIRQKTDQKTVEKLAEQQSDLAVEINNAARELVEKIKEATRQLDKCLVKEKRKYTRQVYDPQQQKMIFVDFEEERPKMEDTEYISKAELKQLASALKDIQSIQMLGKDEPITEAPNINITISAATPEDMESDDE